MSENQLHVFSVRKYRDQRLISFDRPFPSIRPGQFLLVYNPGKDIRLIDIYFGLDLDNGYFSLPESVTWDIGDALMYKGPIGIGFSNLDLFENILCISLSNEIAGLSALIDLSVKHNKNIAFYGNKQPIYLDQSVEIIAPGMLVEAIQWADFIAIETSGVQKLMDYECIDKLKQMRIPVEVLIHKPILCSGDADCMLCAVKTKKGWIKTCQSGSVFKLNELESI